METKAKKIIYEVNVKAQNAIADEFYNWLNNPHIDQMLQIEGFISAKLTTPDIKDDEHKRFTIHYKLESQEAMDNYFNNHAALLRGDGIKRFGDKFTIERRVLTVEKEYKKAKKE
jgi:heme-degrading monooxygenase HmoA